MGIDHLNKAMGFHQQRNWSQTRRHSDLAATKLMQLRDRPVEAISDALSYKCVALGILGRYSEQLECAKEWYCLWNTRPTDMGAICAAFALIDSCIQNKEYADAHLYASTLYEIINHKHDNKIPADRRQHYIAQGAHLLAQTTFHFARTGGIPPAEKQKAGQKAIALARKALEIHTQLHGTEHERVANDMSILADALAYFSGNYDDEVLRLLEQSTAIDIRMLGSSSVNVAVDKGKLGAAYYIIAQRARDANDHNRELTNLERALPHFREAVRIHRVIDFVDKADGLALVAVEIEERLLQLTIARATATTTTTTATKG